MARLPRKASRPAPSGDLKIGDLWAIGEGLVLAGQFVPTSGKVAASEADAEGRRLGKIGRVWGGAKVVRSRPYFILLNPGDQNPRTAFDIAQRLRHRSPCDR